MKGIYTVLLLLGATFHARVFQTRVFQMEPAGCFCLHPRCGLFYFQEIKKAALGGFPQFLREFYFLQQSFMPLPPIHFPFLS